MTHLLHPLRVNHVFTKQTNAGARIYKQGRSATAEGNGGPKAMKSNQKPGESNGKRGVCGGEGARELGTARKYETLKQPSKVNFSDDAHQSHH